MEGGLFRVTTSRGMSPAVTVFLGRTMEGWGTGGWEDEDEE